MAILLGPPIPNTQPSSTPTPNPPSSNTTTSTSSDPFMSLMISDFNAKVNLPVGLTENNSNTYLSSGDPCLDFFFQVVPTTLSQTLTSLLDSSWAHDALTTLKLICHLRGVRGTGKSDKEGFYTAALWLHQNHPKTLAFNIPIIAEFGYLKDPLEILHRLLLGPDVRKLAEEARNGRGGGNRRQQRNRRPSGRRVGKKMGKERPREERVVEAEMAEVSEERKRKRAEMARRVLERYNSDGDFKGLHDATADLFAGMLVRDLECVKKGMEGKVSLAAKWCPSLDSSFDTSTLLCESVARRVFPRETYAEYDGIEEQHYAYRVRDRLRKEVLVPLRKLLELPEVYISAKQWNLLPYNRVPSVAMKNYKNLFLKYDGTRFEEYLSEVRAGTATIAAGALLPHEIIASLSIPLQYHSYSDEEEEKDDNKVRDDEVAELQWIRMVKDLSSKGKLSNSIAVCDVSGSMEGTPMDVCIALGLLTSELSEEPWKGHVITFSESPMLHKIVGDSLRKKASFVRNMEWGTNTDFQKVFDQILKVALEGRMEPKDMIKRVFVFSDMEFDDATGASADAWETDYMVIERKFRECGYGEVVPDVVFWNLRDSRSTPVAANQKGVALVSGFSKNLMKVFLEEGGMLSPVEVMRATISGEEYEGLKVLD